MKHFYMILSIMTIVYTSAYSLTTKVSDDVTNDILELANDAIDHIEENRVYFKPNVIQIIDSQIYVECSSGCFLQIPLIESINGELFITLSNAEKVVYECTKCGRRYYPCPPSRCSCGSVSFKPKLDIIP